MAPEVTALIVAAGSGQRLGSDGPKALAEVAGRPLWEWSLEACRKSSGVGPIVVAAPPGHEDRFKRDDLTVVGGGETRALSVAAGLENVGTEVVLVHDAARPLVTPELIDAAISALAESEGLDAVIAATPVTDTIKRMNGDGRIAATLDRSDLRAAQTPQVCQTDALRDAIARGGSEGATDDAAMIESAGGAVGLVDGPPENFKVTVPSDLARAETLLGSGPRK